MFITINNIDYPLATTLRVAYMVQGQHNHKPYTDIFEGIGQMTLEQQINIVYAAFVCGNKDNIIVKQISSNDFLNMYLDTYDLQTLMQHIQEIIEGIMGRKMEDSTAATESADTPETTVEGN